MDDSIQTYCSRVEANAEVPASADDPLCTTTRRSTTSASRPKKKSLKMVSFPEQTEHLARMVEQVINREDLTDEDRATLWFSNDEYLVLKQDARLESMACEREGQCKSLLDDVFQERCKETQEKLNKWVVDSPGRRGLEKTANQQLGDTRQQAQFQAIMDVLRAQDEMLIAKGGVDAEEVRKVSLKATRTARHFARMIAKADALAADIPLASMSSRDLCSDDNNSVVKRNSSSKSKASKSPSKISSSTSSTTDLKKTSKEKKEEKKAKKKEKEKEAKQKATKDKEAKHKAKELEKEAAKQKAKEEKEAKQKAKEEKQKSKDKDKKANKVGKDRSFKEKLRGAKAGIVARIPRIA